MPTEWMWLVRVNSIFGMAPDRDLAMLQCVTIDVCFTNMTPSASLQQPELGHLWL